MSIWGKRETSESLRKKFPTSADFLRHMAVVMTDFCELSRERFAEAADELEAVRWRSWPPPDGTEGVIPRWQDGRRASVLPWRQADFRREEWVFDRNPAIVARIPLDEEDFPTHYCVLAEPTEETT